VLDDCPYLSGHDLTGEHLIPTEQLNNERRRARDQKFRVHQSKRWLAAERGPAKFSRSHDTVIRVYDKAGNVIETHEHEGDFKEP
jgi:hypothetical protein